MTLIDEYVSSKAERLIKIREFIGLKAKHFADLLVENPSNYYQTEAGARPIGKLKSNELLRKINALPYSIRKGHLINRHWWETGEGDMLIAVSQDESVDTDQSGDRNQSTVNYKGNMNLGSTQDDARQKLKEAEQKIRALERENELLKEINALLKSGKNQ